jgi:hypothetical protein
VGKKRYFNRFDSGEWYTVYPSNGYWESDTPVSKNVEFIIVDKDGNELHREHNGGPKTFQTISERAKQFSEEWAAKLRVASYDEWKKWLYADMEAHGYGGYVDNWLFAETKTTGEETLGSYDHLGFRFCIIAQDVEHKICGKKWRYVFVKNMDADTVEAICGFLYADSHVSNER